jgi:DNA-binding SARP family transcriptional activator
LRWGLSEIRRALGEDGSVDGDPVVLRLGPGTVADALVVLTGSADDAVAAAPGLGGELLAGMAISGDAAFETWLLAQQVRLAATSEGVLHEAALRSMARGALDPAISYAVRAVALNALDENHQALLIRLYRLAGDDDAAAEQFAACRRLLAQELGVSPGPAVRAALREKRHVTAVAGSAAVAVVTPEAEIEALVESGRRRFRPGRSRPGLPHCGTRPITPTRPGWRGCGYQPGWSSPGPWSAAGGRPAAGGRADPNRICLGFAVPGHRKTQTYLRFR